MANNGNIPQACDLEEIESAFKRFDGIAELKKLTLKRDNKAKSKLVVSITGGSNNSQHGTWLPLAGEELVVGLRRLNQVLSRFKLTVSDLFYFRMVHTQKLLSEAQSQHYQQILSVYLEMLENAPFDARHGMADLANQILTHLQTHTVDPDSASIGLPPSDDVVHKLSEHAADVSAEQCKLSKEELAKQILKWSHLSEKEILQAVRVCAASFRGADTLKSGDIAVVRLSGGKYIFARATGNKTDNTVSFYDDPSEVTVVAIDTWDVWPLTKPVMDGMRDVKGMEKLTKQAVETFFASLHQEVKALTLSGLAGLGINVGVTDRATELKMTLYDYDELKQIIDTLILVHADPLHEIFKQSADYIQSKVTSYISQHDKKSMFMPKYNATMQILREYPKIPLARSRVRQLLGTCELALDQLRTSMRKILNGALKAQITEWWLKKIETKVNDFLSSQGYEFTAVPDNYIEQPPDNLELVRINLDIVVRTLDPVAHPESSPVSLIKELRDEIYPVIDDFMRTVMITLCEHLDLDSKPLLNPSSSEPSTTFGFNAAPAIPILKQALDKKMATTPGLVMPTSTPDHTPTTPSNSAVLFEQLGDMIRDLEYLGSMKALEENPNPSEKSLHIVPVGGLVMGSFLRLENELKTVIELWDADAEEEEEEEEEEEPGQETGVSKPPETRAISPIKSLPTDGQNGVTYPDDDANATTFTSSEEATELHYAVCTGLVEKAKAALESQQVLSTINTPDPHGWTALHMAAVLGNWEICTVLLEVPEVDVAAVNEKGSAALHYVVKHPSSPSQLSVIQKLLSMNPALHTVKNRNGETPLHAACLKANEKAVALLVGLPNPPIDTLTIGGETPLHYAVTAGSEAVVNALLSAGASPSVEAKRGTPLDLALGYKHLRIASDLRKALGVTDDHGWPRTTRTPPGQHFSSSEGSTDTNNISPQSAEALAHVAPTPLADPLVDDDSISDAARHIKIGIRKPRSRAGTRSRARSIVDKPDLLINRATTKEGYYVNTVDTVSDDESNTSTYDSSNTTSYYPDGSSDLESVDHTADSTTSSHGESVVPPLSLRSSADSTQTTPRIRPPRTPTSISNFELAFTPSSPPPSPLAQLSSSLPASAFSHTSPLHSPVASSSPLHAPPPPSSPSPPSVAASTLTPSSPPGNKEFPRQPTLSMLPSSPIRASLPADAFESTPPNNGESEVEDNPISSTVNPKDIDRISLPILQSKEHTRWTTDATTQDSSPTSPHALPSLPSLSSFAEPSWQQALPKVRRPGNDNKKRGLAIRANHNKTMSEGNMSLLSKVPLDPNAPPPIQTLPPHPLSKSGSAAGK